MSSVFWFNNKLKKLSFHVSKMQLQIGYREELNCIFLVFKDRAAEMPECD